MRIHFPFILALAVVLVSAACQRRSAFDEFRIRRGTNISHWLSQSDRRGEERRAWFTLKDVEFLAQAGFDHLRIPVDEEQLWTGSGELEPEAFELLHNGIKWCLANGLRVIVDLHILRSHHFNAAEKPLWTDPEAQQAFLDCWRDLSSELGDYPTSAVAYELMNEAVADDPGDWNELLARAHSVVREREPERVIVIGSNRWQSTDTFDRLKVPENDANIILSFHFYTPMVLTHYKASWTKVGEYSGPVSYPGQIIDPENLEGLDPGLVSEIARHNGTFDRQVLEQRLAKPLALAQELDLPLYCGEWGCLPTVPETGRLAWYRDIRANFDSHGIAWATWDYKGGFGIVDREGEPIPSLIDVLLN